MFRILKYLAQVHTAVSAWAFKLFQSLFYLYVVFFFFFKPCTDLLGQSDFLWKVRVLVHLSPQYKEPRRVPESLWALPLAVWSQCVLYTPGVAVGVGSGEVLPASQ